MRDRAAFAGTAASATFRCSRAEMMGARAATALCVAFRVVTSARGIYALGWTLWTKPMRAPLRRRGLIVRQPSTIAGAGVSATGGSIGAFAAFDRGGVSVPLTQTQLASAVADRAEISRNEAKRVLAALEEVVLEGLGNAQKVRVGGLVQLTVRVKPAQKAREGRNPATVEEITLAAKPASVDLRARPLARAKAALPSVPKARRRLAA